MTERPLRIGITCYPTFGGSGVIATEIGLCLAKRGHRIHFICYDVPFRWDRPVANTFFHGVDVRNYPLFDHSPYPLALTSKMVEVSNYEKLDLLHVHYAIPHATSAYLAKQIMGRDAPRVLTTLHGTDITLVGNDKSFLPITRFSIMQSDGLTVPSAYLKTATYHNLGVPETTSIEVIPNFVDTERFRPSPQRDRSELRGLFADKILLGGDTPASVLIHNSNFRELKRVDDVVRIFDQVRQRRRAVLILVGDGPERSRIERLVHELDLTPFVSFLGQQLSFVRFLQNSDVFLLPSEIESFGLAALEALSCGVPVVASRVGGIPEVIRDGLTGILCNVGDVSAMAEATLKLIGEPALWTKMSRAARDDVESRWRQEPMIDRYESCYRRLLETK